MAWYVFFIVEWLGGGVAYILAQSSSSASNIISLTPLCEANTVLTFQFCSEPCIRGHRSTKCTHANERLMVPVRKPGRPLSACPHPRDQPCSCGSVTAAIPRKQACRCGTSTPPMSSGQATPQRSHEIGTDAPSPTKPTFKVQKITSRPQSRRNQSFDPANFERLDMNSINIVPFERPQAIPLTFASGYALPSAPQQYGYVPQYALTQAQFSHIPIQASTYMHSSVPDRPNGFSTENGNGLEHVVENPLATPTELTSSGSNGSSCCKPPMSAIEPGSKPDGTTNGGSCCAPKQASHSHSSSTASSISEPQEIKAGSCCSSKEAPLMMKHEPVSSPGTPNMGHQIVFPNGELFTPALYPQYLPQTTIFTYPPTYGSFQNPLQPSAWRQSARDNSYGHPQTLSALPPGDMPFEAPVVPNNLDTVHTCGCGDGCQCIGCAAHPYNDATQNYVRSAWSSMNIEQAPGDLYTNDHSNGNGHPAPGGDTVTSPTANTPTSATSVNGEEQSLSASDFFFVNYPFSSEDGCGGDTESCPCGDDCQCLGCTIHHQPPIPCEGEKEACPCGDECECIGCEIHNGTVRV
jgi:hypothetical protein